MSNFRNIFGIAHSKVSKYIPVCVDYIGSSLDSKNLLLIYLTKISNFLLYIGFFYIKYL